jgi:hypothetical protein
MHVAQAVVLPWGFSTPISTAAAKHADVFYFVSRAHKIKIIPQKIAILNHARKSPMANESPWAT